MMSHSQRQMRQGCRGRDSDPEEDTLAGQMDAMRVGCEENTRSMRRDDEKRVARMTDQG